MPEFLFHNGFGGARIARHDRFVDQAFDALYREEERWERIIRFAAGFALLVTCLGLSGLVSLVVSRRTREIGIRKVLGAPAASIVGLLSREFACLVVAANGVAWPAAYFGVQWWLQGFAYRIELTPDLFVAGGLGALAAAWLTVGLQTLRAAQANPVEALRYE